LIDVYIGETVILSSWYCN